MGKKTRASEASSTPTIIDRVLGNKWLTIGASAAIIALFAGVGILVVTLLGGDDLSADSSLKIPAPIGPPVATERSAAADILEGKVWDDMSVDERKLVESEFVRAYNDSTFRAKSEIVPGIDVFRQDGFTRVSRQYQSFDAPTGKAVMAELITFNCGSSEDPQPVRYVVTPLNSEKADKLPQTYRPAWNDIVSGANWEAATDLGMRTSKSGLRVHGFELDLRSAPQVTDTVRTEYWIEPETARLIEVGTVFEGDQASTDANWHYLSYDQLPPVFIPPDLEQPDCVKDILSKIGQ